MALSRCWRRSRPRKNGPERASKQWRPRPRSATSCSAHCKRSRTTCTRLSLRREQEAELMDLRSQVAADLLLAAATPVRPEEERETIMKAPDVLSRGAQQLQEPMRAAPSPTARPRKSSSRPKRSTSSRAAVDSRRGSRKLPLASSSKNTNGRHRGYLSSGHEFARKGGM